MARKPKAPALNRGDVISAAQKIWPNCVIEERLNAPTAEQRKEMWEANKRDAERMRVLAKTSSTNSQLKAYRNLRDAAQNVLKFSGSQESMKQLDSAVHQVAFREADRTEYDACRKRIKARDVWSHRWTVIDSASWGPLNHAWSDTLEELMEEIRRQHSSVDLPT